MFKMLWNKMLLFFGLKLKPKKELLNEVEKIDEPKVKRLVYQKRT
jgi:hypothetical protein